MNMEKPAESSKRKKLIQAASFAITFAIAFFAVQYFFFGNKSVEEQLKAAEKQVNAVAPKMIDGYSRLDSASAVGDRMFKYHYTLVEYFREQVNVDTVNKYIRPGIIENVKNSPDMKYFRDHEITMSYNYYDKEGEFVMEIEVTPEMY
ncbi:hypothetical protein NE848_10735 [Gramella jeungdoensis]|uniref:DUF4845 domain-containing protein n=1 Tax=Gramella jeungdoensis TaxID=708091 RepID=A0ABT0Z297_9FLAO|nr:hypothetical protein [Gramella jeungdoensis]MCM8569858.1 hypothetical protein [Gramella jeungdoensis]